MASNDHISERKFIHHLPAGRQVQHSTFISISVVLIKLRGSLWAKFTSKMKQYPEWQDFLILEVL